MALFRLASHLGPRGRSGAPDSRSHPHSLKAPPHRAGKVQKAVLAVLENRLGESIALRFLSAFSRVISDKIWLGLCLPSGDDSFLTDERVLRGLGRRPRPRIATTSTSGRRLDSRCFCVLPGYISTPTF